MYRSSDQSDLTSEIIAIKSLQNWGFGWAMSPEAKSLWPDDLYIDGNFNGWLASHGQGPCSILAGQPCYRGFGALERLFNSS